MGGKPSKSGYKKIEDGKKIKIVVMGDSAGKSTLIRKFVSDKKLKTMAMGDKSTFAEKVLAPWTTAEMYIYECHGPKIRLLFSFLLRKADVVFKLYDSSTPQTYSKVVNKYSRTIKFKAPKAKVFLVGNKADVDVIDAERGVFDVLEVESKHGMIKHIVVSAETGYNVERLFSIAAMDVYPEGTESEIGRQKKSDSRREIHPPKIEIGKHVSSYKMNNKVKGVCLIINNRDFDQSDLPLERRLASRFGTDNDAEELRELFQSLGFVVRQRDNLTDTEMLREVNLIAITEDHSDYNCFVCCILSHGSEKYEGSVICVRQQLPRYRNLISHLSIPSPKLPLFGRQAKTFLYTGLSRRQTHERSRGQRPGCSPYKSISSVRDHSGRSRFPPYVVDLPGVCGRPPHYERISLHSRAHCDHQTTHWLFNHGYCDSCLQPRCSERFRWLPSSPLFTFNSEKDCSSSLIHCYEIAFSSWC